MKFNELAAELVHQLPYPVCISDPEGRVVEVNRAFLKLMGISSSQASGKCIFSDPTLFEDATKLRDCWRRVLRGERALIPEIQLPVPDQQIYAECTLFPLLNSEGAVVWIVAIVRDISDQKRVEQELQHSEGHYQQLVELANSIVLRWDIKGNLTYINDYAENFFGYTRQELLGRSILKTIVPIKSSSGQDLPDMIEDIIHHPGDYVLNENENVTRNGSPVWVAWSNRAILDSSGRVKEILSIGNDRTEHKKLEHQLQQAQKMEAVGRLAGGIAHDFNNILTVVTGHCDLLLSDLEAHSPIRDELNEIRKAAERAAALTSQLLAFSRKQVLRPETLDIGNLLQEMRKMLSRLLGETVELELHTGPVGSVTADPSQIQQVVLNLAINAKDAMPQGGHLRIETSSERIQPGYTLQNISLLPGDYVVIVLSDTGVGIDPLTMERIFEPFFTTKEVGKGTGLGLSTVYGIVKQSSGYIFADSVLGSGSTFSIYLPAVETSPPAQDPPVKNRADLSGTESILVVEDEDSVRGYISKLLEKHGYSVIAAENGQRALELFDPQTISLAVLDLVMPRMGGQLLAEQLLERHPTLKIIYISGHTQTSVSSGILIHKPFRSEQLLQTVRQLLDKG